MKKLAVILPSIAALFLVFVTGATIARFELFPYGYLKNSFDAAEALLIRETGDKVPISFGSKPLHVEDVSSPAVRHKGAGVATYDASRAYNGYTVYTPVRTQFPVRLVDMHGATIHEWTIPFEELKGEREDGLSLEPPLDSLTIAHTRMFPNGDMILVLGVAGYTPWGYGIIKIDKDSKLQWKYLRQAHHDLDLDADGNAYGLLHTVINEPWPGLERISTPFLDDQIVVLDRDGKEQKIVSVLKSIQNSDYVSMLQYARPDRPKGDFLHVNSITWLDARAASALPNAAEGDILVSLRQIGILAVIDIESETVKWATSGPWFMQHDPDVLANGNVLLFDNRGDLVNGGATRIIEFDPQTLEMVWVYPEEKGGDRLYSSIYGSQQRLPNGNTLISESNNGRILEVTSEGDIVWDYRVAERKIDRKGAEVATAVFAERVLPEELLFLE